MLFVQGLDGRLEVLSVPTRRPAAALIKKDNPNMTDEQIAFARASS